jgi:ribosome biogenesis GTPase / thiamine phosphate phosphatase
MTAPAVRQTMATRRRKSSPREKDLTSRYLSGDTSTDRVDTRQRFTQRSKNAEQNKIERTGELRAAESGQMADLESLPIGEVRQVYSLYYVVDHPTGQRLCVVRKTLAKLASTGIVVGDLVRFRDNESRGGSHGEPERLEAVIEQVLPRKTVLTRSSSFLSHEQHPIVANAEQILIVASVLNPRVKWGLVDRMLAAAQSGGLTPLLCLNKVDLSIDEEGKVGDELRSAREVLAHYESLGIATFESSAESKRGIEPLIRALIGKTTVLAGHSGVGKSTLIRAIEPTLDIRIGEVSGYNQKGRHTTTSAQRYDLSIGARVIDTPGVKMFGLWDITPERLEQFFPDVQNGTAPAWRVESHDRIAESLVR